MQQPHAYPNYSKEEYALYPTVEAAQKAIKGKSINTVTKYKSYRKLDERLPSNPDEFYKNKGWESWLHFLDKKRALAKRQNI